MQTTTFVIYPRVKDAPPTVLKIKATGYTVGSNGERVTFEENGTQIAVFNLSELTGFVRFENVVSGQ